MGKRKTSRHSIVCTLIDHMCRPISGREIPQLSLEIVKRAYENKNRKDFCFLSARWCGRVFENSTLLEFLGGLKKKNSGEKTGDCGYGGMAMVSRAYMV